DHRRVNGLVLEVVRLRLGLVLGDLLRLRLDRVMDGVVGEVEEKRAALVRVEELLRFGREPVGEVLAGRALGQGRNLVRGEVAGRVAEVRAGDVEPEAEFFRVIVRPAEVPFADAGGRVTGG